mmetsp:Transcript_115509/g.331537  ORF Transcript_115509/g.331537 Transcript_115509/m.331537 type:complete len:226 (+) Transcript_115509:109-786(+)
MKLLQSISLLSTIVSTVEAFAPLSHPRQNRPTLQQFMVAEQDVVAESAMPVSDPYERIGITEEELAIGIDATEFLQWIGSKEELVQKFQRDNKGMDEARANAEVSKFMMDAEMVNAYIKFERDKVENPPDLKAQAQANLSDPVILGTYAAWLIGGASFGYIRKEIIEPKYASGEWQEIHITLPGFNKEEAANAVQSVASILHSMETSSTLDSAHSGIDNIVSTMV